MRRLLAGLAWSIALGVDGISQKIQSELPNFEAKSAIQAEASSGSPASPQVVGSCADMDVLAFPTVPVHLLDGKHTIEPCDQVRDWAAQMFLTPGQYLHNPEHEHLFDARIGFCWTNVTNTKQGKQILGTAQVGEPGGTAWAKIRAEEQLVRWFGHVPDYLITLDAVWLSTARPEHICAVVEHELYHCWVQIDEFGDPKLDKYGNTKPAIRPHDVEVFVGEAARYGMTLDERRVALRDAILRGPQFKVTDLGGVCGTCR